MVPLWLALCNPVGTLIDASNAKIATRYLKENGGPEVEVIMIDEATAYAESTHQSIIAKDAALHGVDC